MNILVTGGSRGIGRAIALGLAGRGARIALHYRENRAAAESVLAALPGVGHAIFPAEIGDEAAVEDLWRAVIAQFGHVDVLINNAAIYEEHPTGRVVQPEEVASAAVFCALDAPAAMTGSIIDVNGASYLRT